MYAFVHSCLLLAHLWALPAAGQGDVARVRAEMTASARAYESALRRYAPQRWGAAGGACDEQIGRFCLTYDAGRPAVPPEPPEAAGARMRAIRAYRAGIDVLGADSLAAAFLVRYLIEADSAEAALAVSRAVPAAWGALLEGLAGFEALRTEEALAAFERALPLLDTVQLRRLTDPTVLLEPRERSRFRQLAGAARVRYLARLWSLADPLYLTPGNESRAEHQARYVWTRILARAPVVIGSFTWGWDIDEITRRFGVPVSRSKDARGAEREAYTEYFDPEQMVYVPPELSRFALPPFEPGASWPYDTIRSRSGFAAPTVRAMTTLPHQPSILRRHEGTWLRADAALALDTIAAVPTRVAFGLFVLDSSFQIIAEARDTIAASEASAAVVAALTVPLARHAYAYSIEALELGSRQAARARHLLLDGGSRTLLLSDPILRDTMQRPLPSLVVQKQDEFAVLIEAAGLQPNGEDAVRYRVELTVEEARTPAALTRALRRLRGALGLQRLRPRVTWSAQTPAASLIPIEFRLGQLRLGSGRQRLRFVITDLITGASASVERELLVR